MMGLFSPPAVILLLGAESTPVISTAAVGQSADRVSRVTCWAARAVNRDTVICGLLAKASCSASLIDRALGALGVGEVGAVCCAPVVAGEAGASCGTGACGSASTEDGTSPSRTRAGVSNSTFVCAPAGTRHRSTNQARFFIRQVSPKGIFLVCDGTRGTRQEPGKP